MHSSREPVYLSRHGRRIAVIVDADEFDRLLEATEDTEDAGAAVAARREMHETSELPVPWGEVKETARRLNAPGRSPDDCTVDGRLLARHRVPGPMLMH